MCINYQNFNEFTIKNWFPIPLVKELLDEVHGSVIFSKIYLCSDIIKCVCGQTTFQKRLFVLTKVMLNSWLYLLG